MNNKVYFALLIMLSLIILSCAWFGQCLFVKVGADYLLLHTIILQKAVYKIFVCVVRSKVYGCFFATGLANHVQVNLFCLYLSSNRDLKTPMTLNMVQSCYS